MNKPSGFSQHRATRARATCAAPGSVVLSCVALLASVAACDTAPSGSGPRAVTDPHYAVVSSDYASCSVALLDGNGELLEDDYLTSGSTSAGLVAALSGDVVLPTRSGEKGVLVLIDRYKTDVITRVRLEDGEILGQVKTHTPPSQETDNAYSSNPQDYVYIDESTAWVSRSQPNLDPDVAEIDRGNDLLRIDPSKMERTEERIDLSSLDTSVTRVDPTTDDEQEVAVYARPTRFVRIEDTLVVGLTRAAFDYSAYAEGMIALVDLESREVSGFALEELKNCVGVEAVPGAQDRVLVTCAGAFGEERDTAGFALLRVKAGKASVEQLWRAAEHPDDALLTDSSVSLGGTLIAAAANSWSGAESVFAMLDLETGEQTEIARLSTGAFGTPHFDAEQKLLLLPDPSVDQDMTPTGGVKRFRLDEDGSLEELELVEVGKDSALPAQYVFAL